jgi:hypothetical protein
MRRKIDNTIWEQIRTAFAAGVGLREIARKIANRWCAGVANSTVKAAILTLATGYSCLRWVLPSNVRSTMKKTSKRKPFFVILLSAGLLPICVVASDQRLDGVWVGAEKLSLAKRTDCPPPNYKTFLPAKIAVGQGGSLLAVVDGYGPGRYTNLHWSGDTLVFEIANKRKGELHLSPDGKTLIEKGSVRRTATITSGQRESALSGKAPQVTGFTACLDELTGTFHRER